MSDTESNSEDAIILKGRYKFDEHNKVGEGTYGEVYCGEDIQEKKSIALKKIRFSESDDGIPSTALREIALLNHLQGSPCVMGLKDIVLEKPRELYLVLDYAETDLHRLMKHYRQIGELVDPNAAKSFLFQLLHALSVCHANRVFHRDLKPANVMISSNGSILLGDFGLARNFEVPMRAYTHEVVTLWYRAPEILLGTRHYSTAIDVWATGCIFAELFRGKALFRGDSEIDQLFQIFSTLGTPTEDIWEGVSYLQDFNTTIFPHWPVRHVSAVMGDYLDRDGLDLLQKMLTFDPSRRITAKDALSHSYFSIQIQKMPKDTLVEDKHVERDAREGKEDSPIKSENTIGQCPINRTHEESNNYLHSSTSSLVTRKRPRVGEENILSQDECKKRNVSNE